MISSIARIILCLTCKNNGDCTIQYKLSRALESIDDEFDDNELNVGVMECGQYEYAHPQGKPGVWTEE